MELKKNLKFFGILGITIGAMMSSGLFILPGPAYSEGGPSIIVSYALAGVCAFIGSLSMVELTTAMPKAGGVYFFASRTLGDMAGVFSGVLMWMAIAMKAAFAIYGLSLYLSYFTGADFFLTGVTITLIFTLLNIRGVGETAFIIVLLVGTIVAIMCPFIVLGIRDINLHLFYPFIKGEGTRYGIIFATTAFVFVAFGGLANTSSVSEEMKNPKRDVPLAVFSSIIIVTILYVAILAITIGILSPATMKNTINPIASAGKVVFGEIGYIVITIAACFAFCSCANSGIMSSARYPLALSRDGFAPKFVGYMDRKNNPAASILLTAVFIMIILCLDIKMLVEAASTVIITSYIITDLSVMILRFSKITNYRPTFKAPFFPLTQIISIIIFGGLIFMMGKDSIEISLGLIACSFLLYLFYAKKGKRKFALLHLVERITNRDITTDSLEDELKTIVSERENLIVDEVHKSFEKAKVLDLKGPISLMEFLERTAMELEDRIDHLNAQDLYELFLEREKEGSSVISEKVAIPHIILDAQKEPQKNDKKTFWGFWSRKLKTEQKEGIKIKYTSVRP